MAGYTLYTHLPSYRASKILVAAEYAEIKLRLPAFVLGKDNTTPEFLAKSPLGRVPVLETPNGCLFESNAIVRYVARLRSDTGLYGFNLLESGQVDQWIDFSANELEPIRCVWLYPLQGLMPFDQKTYESAKADMKKALQVLENHLHTRTYLVGHRITLADIVTVSALVDCFRTVFDPQFRAQFVNVLRWFTTCVNQPQFAAVLGKVEFAATEQTYGSKPAKAGKPAKEQQPKPAKQPKASKPAEDTKEAEQGEAAAADAAPRASEANLDLMDSLEQRPKKANPLDLLPASPMILDSVKKLFFLKRPNFAEFFAEFWPQFDAQGYCVYVSHYNFNADNTVYFMTCNLVGGWVQRLEELRKYAFGAVMVTGKDEETAPFDVSGVWIFRGTGIPAEMSECPDSEYHTFKRIDVSTEAGRQLVEAFFTHATIEGQAVLDRRYFK